MASASTLNYTETVPSTESNEPPNVTGHSGNGIIIGIVVIVVLLCLGCIIGYIAVMFCGKKAGIDDGNKSKGVKGGKSRKGSSNSKKSGKGGKMSIKMRTSSVKQKMKPSRSCSIKRRSSRRSSVTPKNHPNQKKSSFLKQNVKAATLKNRPSTIKKRPSRSQTVSRKKMLVAGTLKQVQPQPKLVKMDTTLKAMDYSKIDQAISKGAKILKSRSKSRSKQSQPVLKA